MNSRIEKRNRHKHTHTNMMTLYERKKNNKIEYVEKQWLV